MKLLKVTKLQSLNNRTYKIKILNYNFFFKPSNLNNKKVISLLKTKNLTPKAYINNNKYLITKFLEDASLNFKEDYNKEFFESFILRAKDLHALKTNITFNPFKEIKNNISLLVMNNFNLHKEIHLLQHKLNLLEKKLTNEEYLGFCHNDLNSSNILFYNKEILFIDFDYSGMNDIFYDLATFCWFLSKEEKINILTLYFGQYEEKYLLRLDDYLFVVKFWNATWSYLKSLNNEGNYDYKKGGDLILEELLNSI